MRLLEDPSSWRKKEVNVMRIGTWREGKHRLLKYRPRSTPRRAMLYRLTTFFRFSLVTKPYRPCRRRAWLWSSDHVVATARPPLTGQDVYAFGRDKSIAVRRSYARLRQIFS
jgi:hypothetical protein